MSTPPRRPWIDAMDGLARRQHRFMLAGALAWVVLALAQAVGLGWMWATGWDLVVPPPRVVFPGQDAVSAMGCSVGGANHFGCWSVDGLRTSLWAWAAAALLPWLVVPPRRSAPPPTCAAAMPTSPYREGVSPVSAAPDEPTRRRSRRARRCLVAVASVSWIVLRAHPQAVILGPSPRYVEINGVAVLAALFAVAVVLAYVGAAAWPPTRRAGPRTCRDP